MAEFGSPEQKTAMRELYDAIREYNRVCDEQGEEKAKPYLDKVDDLTEASGVSEADVISYMEQDWEKLRKSKDKSTHISGLKKSVATVLLAKAGIRVKDGKVAMAQTAQAIAVLARHAAKADGGKLWTLCKIGYKGQTPQPAFTFNATDMADAVSKAKNWCRYHSMNYERDATVRESQGVELNWPPNNDWVKLAKGAVVDPKTFASALADEVSKAVRGVKGLKYKCLKYDAQSKTILILIDTERQFRHPDEYGGDKMEQSPEYAAVEDATSKVFGIMDTYMGKYPEFQFEMCSDSSGAVRIAKVTAAKEVLEPELALVEHLKKGDKIKALHSIGSVAEGEYGVVVGPTKDRDWLIDVKWEKAGVRQLGSNGMSLIRRVKSTKAKPMR